MPYHITKTPTGQFLVVLLGKNGKALSITETFKRKASAWNNICSQIENAFNIGGLAHLVEATVQDDTVEVPEVWEVDSDGVSSRVYVKAKPKYIPGKNPKKKK